MSTLNAAILSEPRRHPSIAGSRNFRDLGGYRTTDGHTIRWGRIYRSGTLAKLLASGTEALRNLGVQSLCDLRTTRERSAQPYAWRDDFALDYWCRDYETSFGELRVLLQEGIPSGEQARSAMMEGYRRMPFEQAPAYCEIFSRLANGNMPLVFCCSAGKDRAGIAAALILTALGVPRESVIADYLLTDASVDLEREIVHYANGDSSLSRQPTEVVRAILGCDASYIAAALDAVAPSAAAFDSYLHDTLHINAAALASIRADMLE